MSAGVNNAINLSRKLLLEAPVRTPDGAGGFSETWIVLGEMWAEVTARTGREKLGEATPLSSVNYSIIVRGAPRGSDARPLPEQRFREGTRVFRILAVAERDPAGRYLTCFADEEVVA